MATGIERDEFFLGRQRQDVMIIGLAVFVALLFVLLEVLRKHELNVAVISGQRVELVLGNEKTYARLRDDTRQMLEMTARTQEALRQEQQSLATNAPVDDQERALFIAKNTDLLEKIEAVWIRVTDHVRGIALNPMARK